jgi:hypothetical protein
MRVRLDNPGQEAGGGYKVTMKCAHPRSPFLEQLYQSRPDLEALVNAGEEAVLRRMEELEAILKIDENQKNDLKLSNGVEERVVTPE